MGEPLLRPRIRSKLDAMAARLRAATDEVSRPGQASDRIASLQREIGRLHPTVEHYDRVRALVAELRRGPRPDRRSTDRELADLARAEVPELERRGARGGRGAARLDCSQSEGRRVAERGASRSARARAGPRRRCGRGELRDVYVRFADRQRLEASRSDVRVARPISAGCARPWSSRSAVRGCSTGCASRAAATACSGCRSTESQGRDAHLVRRRSRCCRRSEDVEVEVK
jgi:hypothetical protein